LHIVSHDFASMSMLVRTIPLSCDDKLPILLTALRTGIHHGYDSVFCRLPVEGAISPYFPGVLDFLTELLAAPSQLKDVGRVTRGCN
jgi:hypothetical protein